MMWELLKKMAQGAVTLGAETFESWTLIERLVSMPNDQALEQLRVVLQGMDDRAFIVFTRTLAAMATTEENRIQELKSAQESNLSGTSAPRSLEMQATAEAYNGPDPQQLQQRELRLRALQGLLNYANQTRKQAGPADVTAVADDELPVSRARPEIAAAPVTTHQRARTKAKRPRGVLVDGSPALSQQMVDQICEYYEWILDVELTATLRTGMRTMLVAIWTEKDQQTIQNVLHCIAVLKEVKKVDQATRNFWREENQANSVRVLRAATNEVSRGLLELYDAANAPIAPGNPPLTREMTDCYLELTNFMRAVASETEPIVLTMEIKDAWAEKLAAAYEDLPLEERMGLTEAPRLWTEILAVWPQMPEADKAKYKEGWAKQKGLFPEREVPSAEAKKTSVSDTNLLQTYKEKLPTLQEVNKKTSGDPIANHYENLRMMQDMMSIHQTYMRSNSNW